MHDESLVGEFSHQAESFNRSQAANAPETLAALVELADPRPGERWLEAACGPGVVARALAPRAGSVHGVDLTPAMVELARREAAGLENATFSVGDATALPDPDGVGASLYAALETTGNRPVREVQRISAASLGAADARLLGVPAGAAGLHIERISYLASGKAIEFTRSLYRGDSYDFVVEMRLAEAKQEAT